MNDGTNPQYTDCCSGSDGQLRCGIFLNVGSEVSARDTKCSCHNPSQLISFKNNAPYDSQCKGNQGRNFRRF